MTKHISISGIVGVAWFAVWLAGGTTILQWALTNYARLFELFLPAYFVAWIASLFLVRAAIAVIAKKLLVKNRRDHGDIQSVLANSAQLQAWTQAYLALHGQSMNVRRLNEQMVAPYAWGRVPHSSDLLKQLTRVVRESSNLVVRDYPSCGTSGVLEKDEIDVPPTEVKAELTPRGVFAYSLIIYTPQEDLGKRMAAERFVRNAKDNYEQSYAQELRL